MEGPLADTVLELHDSTGAIIALNDNWKDAQQAEIEAARLGDASGVALVEAYNFEASGASRQRGWCYPLKRCTLYGCSFC